MPEDQSPQPLDEVVSDEVASAEIVPAEIVPVTASPPVIAPVGVSPFAGPQSEVIAAQPITWRELVATALLVTLSDLTIYRGEGYAGYAAFFAGGLLIFASGANRRNYTRSFVVVSVMIAALAIKLVWCGSPVLVGLGFGLLAAGAMTLTGQCPYVLELLMFVAQTIRSGWEALLDYSRTFNRTSPRISSFPLINVILPAVAFFAFSLIFVLANPDLFSSISGRLDAIISRVRYWMSDFSLFELIFWLVTGWFSLGLLRPWSGAVQIQPEVAAAELGKPTPAPLYAAFRNTLLTVIALFSVYLVFEFTTLWFRDFPAGFHYSGYAHEGAAWLTVALALATATLSLVFRGSVLLDPRLVQLRRLAWIWSALNLLLALSVYNRLFIYVGFNGMTPMRMVGLFGITLVGAGFVLVIIKIVKNHDAIWLIRRHLLAFALTVYLFCLTPVDLLVVRYNVARILKGDEAPCVQMTVQQISSEGVLALRPLLNCDNLVIREGVQAMLANRLEMAEQEASRQEASGWTAFQLADQRVMSGLRDSQTPWRHFKETAPRDLAWQRFKDYAYQWY